MRFVEIGDDLVNVDRVQRVRRGGKREADQVWWIDGGIVDIDGAFDEASVAASPILPNHDMDCRVFFVQYTDAEPGMAWVHDCGPPTGWRVVARGYAVPIIGVADLCAGIDVRGDVWLRRGDLFFGENGEICSYDEFLEAIDADAQRVFEQGMAMKEYEAARRAKDRSPQDDEIT